MTTPQQYRKSSSLCLRAPAAKVRKGAEADRQVPGHRMGEADIERAPDAMSGFLWLGPKSRQAAPASLRT